MKPIYAKICYEGIDTWRRCMREQADQYLIGEIFKETGTIVSLIRWQLTQRLKEKISR